MIKGKIAGITIGGLAGYLLINKSLNIIREAVNNVCDAAKWRSYYRHNKDDLCVPPGYESSSRKINDDTELVVEDPKQKKQDSDEKEDASVNDLKASISAAFKEGIDAWVKGKKGVEEATEGQETASENDILAEFDDKGCNSEDSCPIDYGVDTDGDVEVFTPKVDFNLDHAIPFSDDIDKDGCCTKEIDTSVEGE